MIGLKGISSVRLPLLSASDARPTTTNAADRLKSVWNTEFSLFSTEFLLLFHRNYNSKCVNWIPFSIEKQSIPHINQTVCVLLEIRNKMCFPFLKWYRCYDSATASEQDITSSCIGDWVILVEGNRTAWVNNDRIAHYNDSNGEHNTEMAQKTIEMLVY